jgi:DNA-binding response OmpR family regulator
METRILLIEDDPAIQTGMKDMLDLENYETIVCSDGREGLDTAMKENPDLILLDISLPSMSGFDVCRKLRERNFRNPIIMLTSRGEQVDKILGLELGANDYVTKPFDSRELLARIHSQLRSREVLNENLYKDNVPVNERSTRRLLVIMFTDIKDYSKKMGSDEKLALKLLSIHNEIVTETVKLFDGRIKEVIGDAFVVSFESALKSVECACEIQKRFKDYNETASPEDQIEIRIGIHLGDVIEYDNKVIGDAVNIAARIQENAIAGGVTMSESVYSAVKNKVSFNIFFTGEKSFKNIKEPVNIYVVES